MLSPFQLSKMGGPATGCGLVDDGDDHPPFYEGMTLWDWYAGQALAGLLARGFEGPPMDIATAVARQAKAMLNERRALLGRINEGTE